jgi:DNA helicase-2/ATP-dependent DNA helicase PcrA
MFYADLHVHSRFSRATSRDCDLEHLAHWAGKKGISVVGTGDFTHPGWFEEIQAKLAPAEPGLYRLRPELEKEAPDRLGEPAPGDVRFMLQVEISTIYKKDGRTRKVHHLVYVPEIDHARRLSRSLARIGNIASDGRPILGLDSRHLLEIVLESGEGCYLVPAHIWTPWFAVLGSQSGFDSIEQCYGDLSGHVFALETGLSSDPAMNWRLSGLDRYALISNSDAHSPPKLGREACVFDTERDYFAIRRALETGEGYCGTVEFFPEEGKYHFDGHRKCGVCLSPGETRRQEGKCPVCGKPVTLGVMYRVCELADRAEPPDPLPQRAAPFRSMIPLEEILSEVCGVGPQSNTVRRKYEEVLARLGPELFILERASAEDIARAASSALAEGIVRMREGRVIREAGFDGQYGTIRLFSEDELRRRTAG